MLIVGIRALQAPRVASWLDFTGTKTQLINQVGSRTQSTKDNDLSLSLQEIAHSSA